MRILNDDVEHLPLVSSIAQRYTSERPIEDTEEWADGMMALLRAKTGFNPNLGFAFSTYATKAIRRAIWRGQKLRKSQAKPSGDGFDFVAPAGKPAYPLWLLEELQPSADDNAKVARYKFVLTELFLEEKTLERVGGELGLTKERTRQIKEDALIHFRLKFGRILEDYV